MDRASKYLELAGGEVVNRDIIREFLGKEFDDKFEDFVKFCFQLLPTKPIDWKILDLERYRVTEEAMSTFRKMVDSGSLSNLQVLRMSMSNFTTTAVVILAQTLKSGSLKNLQKLILERNFIGPERIGAIAASLRAAQLPGLEELSLGSNCCGDEGAKALAAAFASGAVKGLQKLWLDWNQIGHEGIGAIAIALQAGQLPGLKELHLGNNRCGDEGAKALAAAFASGAVKSLQKLRLHSNEIGYDGIKAIAAALRAAGLLGMEELDLTSNICNKERARALCVAFTSGSGLVKDLPKFRLHETEISLERIGAIAAALEAGQAPGLEVLSLSSHRCGDEGAMVLSVAFKSGAVKRLQELRLSENEIGNEGIGAIAAALRAGQMPGLKSLDLGNNLCGDEGAKALGAALTSGAVKGLQKLWLRLNKIGNEGIEAIATSLRTGQLPGLEELDLGSNRCGDKGAKALGTAFASGHVKDLQKLVLRNNQIGYKGIGAIAAALRAGLQAGIVSELHGLDLALNSLGDEGAIAIADWLQSSPTMSLDSLYLTISSLSPRGKNAILSSYKQNTYLTTNIHCDGDWNFKQKQEKLREQNLQWMDTLRLLEGEKVPGTHGKVFLCGKPGVGKTTLKRTLLKTWRDNFVGFCTDSTPEPTRGIEVSKMRGQDSVELSIWDLAGQHEYEVLHSCFLPDLAIADGQAIFFIIVCNANSKQGSSVKSAIDSLEHWLRFISSNSTGKQRRVLVILNCFGDDKEGHDHESWEGTLASLKEEFSSFINLYPHPYILNVTTRSGVKLLRKALLCEARQILQMREMPKICFEVDKWCKKWAEKHKKYPVRTWQEYARDLHFFSKERLEAATVYLHEAGRIIFFNGKVVHGSSFSLDDNSKPFRLVIFDPDWFCQNVIGELLLPQRLLRKDEFCVRDFMERDGSIPKVRLQHLDILKERLEEGVYILMRLGLVYQLPDAKDKIFVPALIANDETPSWFTHPDTFASNGHAWVTGFSLVPRDLKTTRFPIAALRKMQVKFAESQDIGQRSDSAYQAGVSRIMYKHQQMGILIEYSSERDRVDVLVKPLVEGLQRQDQVNMAYKIVDEFEECCLNLEMEIFVIQPWSCLENFPVLMKRDIRTSLQEVIDRVQKKGGNPTNWTVRGEVVQDLDLLPEEELHKFQRFIEDRYDATRAAVEVLSLDAVVGQDAPEDDNNTSNPNKQVEVDPQMELVIRSIKQAVHKGFDGLHKRLDGVESQLSQLKVSTDRILEMQADLRGQQANLLGRVRSLETF